LINKFSYVSSFVLLSIIPVVCGLISHSPIVCDSFSFAIAKATRQDASSPNVSSETNHDMSRVPTARNWAQVAVMYVCEMEWSELTKLTASSKYYYQALWGKRYMELFNIICYD